MKQPIDIIYTPDSFLKHPKQLFKEMIDSLYASRELAWRLFVRNIKAEYRQSFLGVFWALLPAAITAAGCTLANRAGVLNIGNTAVPYPAYVMLGMTLWQTFIEAFNGPQSSMKTSRALLAQIKFPHEAIILSQLGQISFNLLIKLFFVIIIFGIFQVPVSWTVIFAPLAFFSLLMLGTGIGLLLIPITNLIKDVSKSLEVIILIWFFITPVAYPIPTEGIMSAIVRLNPATPLLVTAQELVTTGELSFPLSFCIVSFFALAGVLLGWLTFRLSIPYLVERIS